MADTEKPLSNTGLSYLLGKIKTRITEETTTAFNNKTVLLTTEEYETLTTKDSNTLYCIVEES